MSRGWKAGSTYYWRTVVRPAVLARDGYRCQIRHPGTWRTRTQEQVRCRVVADCVHHLHGKARCAGCNADQLDHLAAACGPCNLRTGDPGRRAGGPRVARNPAPKIMTRW